jgi:hypothetical protein
MPVIRLNITDGEGVLLGQVALDAATLDDSSRCAESIGWQVLNELPVPRRGATCDHCGERPARGMSNGLCVECIETFVKLGVERSDAR